MSMALALEYTAEWYRDKYGWDHTQCGVQINAYPPIGSMSPFFIGIDDAGVETGADSTDSLKEVLTIVVGIWRRPEHIQKSIRGNLKLPQDKYLIGAWTLHDLERAVVIHKTVGGATAEGKHGLHANYVFMDGLNQRYNLPGQYGAEFKFPFMYRGRGSMESIAIEGSQDPTAYYGYRLRFRGLAREQKLRSETDAIG